MPLVVWDPALGAEVARFEPRNSKLIPAGFTPYAPQAFSPDGQQMATCIHWGNYTRGEVAIWDLKTNRKAITLPTTDAIMAPPLRVAYSPDGKQLVTATADRIIRVWDTETWTEKYQLRGHRRMPNWLMFSGDGHRLASATSWGSIGYSGVADKDNPLGLTSDDPHAPSELKIWDTPTGKEVLSREWPDTFGCLAYHFDSNTAALLARDQRTVRMYDVATNTELPVLKGHANGVRGAAFSPDGRRLVTGGLDHRLLVWDVKTGQEVIGFHHPPGVISVAFSPDGSKIASTSFEGLRVLDGTPLGMPVKGETPPTR
jgi:WD40 repeat protein